MKPKNNQHGQDRLTWDFSYIYRCILRNALVIIMSACIAGGISYIFFDYYLKDTYTADVHLALVARDSSRGKIGDGAVKAATIQSWNILNSDTLKEQILKNEKNSQLSGDLMAEFIEETNLITMQATCDSAENALRLLKAALDTFPLLSASFESGYLIKNVTILSANSITATRANPSLYAAVVALLVVAGGIGLTIAMCYVTDEIHNEDQAVSVLDLEMLGSVPNIKKKGQKAILISGAKTDISYLEEIDKVVTRIHERMESNQFKILMISSLHSNEGKSTIAANISLNLEKRGKRDRKSTRLNSSH